MKQWVICVFILAFAPVFGREKFLPEPRQIVSMAELDSALINELVAGGHPDVAIELKPGAEIPFRLFHRCNPFFSLAVNPNVSAKVEKLCYLRFVKKKVYISQDLVTWEKPTADMHRPTAKFLLDSAGVLVETANTEKVDRWAEFEDEP